MVLSQEFRETLQARAGRDATFRLALLTNAIDSLLGGDSTTGKALLRDYVNATVGFEQLANQVKVPAKSLHRMLGAKGNPRADNLFRILAVLQEHQRVNAVVQLHGAGRVPPGRSRGRVSRVQEPSVRYDSMPARRCIVIAGSNGSGKTTFAREYLPREAGVVHFVNADLVAGGLSPLKPELAALASGRLVLAELDRLAAAQKSFAFESTLSGLAYLGRLQRWKAAGYFIKLVYLKLDSPALALRRIAARVRQGGHDVPRADVLRRFGRSLENFHSRYKLLADAWELYDNSGERPQLLEVGP